MTDFLLLNNYPIPLAEWAEEENEIGAEDEHSAGANMQLQSDTRKFKRRWTGHSSLLNGQVADTTELWIQGQCWHVGFEIGLQSTGGLCPDPGYAATMSNVDKKFGTYSIFGASSASLAKYRIPIRTRSNDWSISLWYRDVDGGGVWTHLCIVSRQGTIARWINGANVASSAGSTVVIDSPTTNAIRFELKAVNPTGVASTSFFIDDVILFNWPLNNDQVTALATATRAFSEVPVLEASGDFLHETGPLLVRGMVDSEAYTQVQDPTLGWDNNQRPISFSIEEV